MIIYNNNNFYYYLQLNKACATTISPFTNNITIVINDSKNMIKCYTYNPSCIYSHIHIFINFIKYLH